MFGSMLSGAGWPGIPFVWRLIARRGCLEAGDGV